MIPQNKSDIIPQNKDDANDMFAFVSLMGGMDIGSYALDEPEEVEMFNFVADASDLMVKIRLANKRIAELEIKETRSRA